MLDGIVDRGDFMTSLFFAILGFLILRSYPNVKDLTISEFKKRLLLRLIIISGCISFSVVIFMAIGLATTDIEEGRPLIGGLILVVTAIFCLPLVLYMLLISIFAKFSFFDSQMKFIYRID